MGVFSSASAQILEARILREDREREAFIEQALKKAFGDPLPDKNELAKRDVTIESMYGACEVHEVVRVDGNVVSSRIRSLLT